MSRPCPACGSPTVKVIYFGLPGRLCTNETCCCLDGIASMAPPVATDTPFGPMFAYLQYDGSYWRALWRWLTGW